MRKGFIMLSRFHHLTTSGVSRENLQGFVVAADRSQVHLLYINIPILRASDCETPGAQQKSLWLNHIQIAARIRVTTFFHPTAPPKCDFGTLRKGYFVKV